MFLNGLNDTFPELQLSHSRCMTPINDYASYRMTRIQKETVAEILKRCAVGIVDDWLTRVKKCKKLHGIILTDRERTGYLPKLIEDLVLRLERDAIPGKESNSICSVAAMAHGRTRKSQGYSAGMLVQDSRILEVALFETLRQNLNALDFNSVLADVMTIADEVDSQLTQAVDSYMKAA
jgi:hypothetical protein